MDEKELEFSLDDILKEFSNAPLGEEDQALLEAVGVSVDLSPEKEPEAVNEAPAPAELEDADADVRIAAPVSPKPVTPASTDTVRLDPVVTGDTVRLDTAVTADTVRLDTAATADTVRLDPVMTGDTVRLDAVGVPADDDTRLYPPTQTESFTRTWEPEYEQPIGEYVPPKPISFRPNSKLQELKRKLVSGPEKQYYKLSERGSGKLQAAIFLSLLVVLLSAGVTVLDALGMIRPERMKLLVFSQFLAMLISALLGSFQLIDGLADIVRKRFSLNSLMLFTFLACVADGIVCLRQLKVPCCAAFSLQVTMSLWSSYQVRTSRLGQLDTLRKATRLDGIVAEPDYYDGMPGYLRAEGRVEDFMDTYTRRSGPEKMLSIYGFVALLVSIGVGVTAGVLHGASFGIRVLAVTLLAATPATIFIAVTRPFAILGRRLHKLGTVLCGWHGIKALCGKAVFPVTHDDLFPVGTVKLNGVKFFSDREPDQTVAYATALICADNGGLVPLFTQLLDSRNGIHYTAREYRAYEEGGIGAVVNGEAVLAGSLSFLEKMGVEIPKGIRVGHAVCVAVGGELCGLFAVAYEKVRETAAGVTTLCSYRGLHPILISGDFMLREGFLRSRFGSNVKKILIPEYETREALRKKKPKEEAFCLLLTTKPGLAPMAYGVSGARAFRTASMLGGIIHIIGGGLGIGMMLVLAIMGAGYLLTPTNLFLYELIWMIPGLLITEWTRAV